MDSDEDTFDNDNVDSGNVSSGDDGDDDFAMEVDAPSSRDRQMEPEEYQYEVLTTDQIVQHMTDCINDVNGVVDVSIYILYIPTFFYRHLCIMFVSLFI